MALKHEDGTRTGWLMNYHASSAIVEGDEATATKEASVSALDLLFLGLEGETFVCKLKYNPYFFVAVVDGHEREVELGLASAFAAAISSVFRVDKEDLNLVNHLSGKRKTYLKVEFANTADLTAVRSKIEAAIKRNACIADSNALAELIGAANVPSGDHRLSWMDWLSDMREYDVKYFMRVAIDLGIHVGHWYDVTVRQGDVTFARCDDSKYPPAQPKICAFDIETTKSPLRFPQPEIDQIYMISYMIDRSGYLIVNREIVAEAIASFEYTPRPEYEGVFEVFNEENEKALLERFFNEMKIHAPHVFVTYNGDYFDFPFLHARAAFHRMSLKAELGFSQAPDGATLHYFVPHLDCFYWVKRDSYLPQGSHGLKAVTKAKLGYEPIEVDPEDMLPLAQNDPQRMAAYSVSDAVSTYYLYMKYVHPFIFSLCTIIPMPPDDVLRKGSGTLCESLLCVQAYQCNVVFPNKKVQAAERYFNGQLIDTETYIGGHVEALQSGVFRSDIPMKFSCNPQAYKMLIDNLDSLLQFALENENGVKVSDVTNYDSVRGAIAAKLEDLMLHPVRHERPLIYHLDVGAMYPNIILTNRLQPPSVVSPEMCAGCVFNTPANESQCRRTMSWIYRAELFTAGRHEVAHIKTQLESEAFSEAIVEKAKAKVTQRKKAYGQRSGNVLEGTKYERKPRDAWRGMGRGRAANRQAEREGRLERSSSESGSSSSDEGGNRRFGKLAENAQYALLKKRLTDYCRKAHGKIHESREIMKESTICQRENSFYVDTVRRFRDRRYFYKRELKRWKEIFSTAKDRAALKEAEMRCVQMESLQIAHKCILNSFYGYVMRKGSRWYSMEMAGIITYLGASLITMARQLVQQIGVPLELDTDGIWCCLPASFPENFKFTTSDPKKPTVPISFPCIMLNRDVHQRYTNHQYQDMVTAGEYEIHSENSIYFEVDGPYLAMILPASREEGKSIKKRYAVFHPDGRLAELKGFELKRRGELVLIKDFQSQVFRHFLNGSTLAEAYRSAACVADEALDMLFTKGQRYEEEEILAKLTESSNMSRRLSEYPEGQKSFALTTARRIAEFLGPQMVKDKGLSCAFIIAQRPIGRPVTERAIPTSIFKAESAVRAHYLAKWTGDHSLAHDVKAQHILDWDYYIGRMSGAVQKVITIPAALQHIPNPVPRISHPEWLEALCLRRSSTLRQTTLMLRAAPQLRDIEDVARSVPRNRSTSKAAEESQESEESSDDDDDDSDVEVVEARKAAEAAEHKRAENLRSFHEKHFQPKSTTFMGAGVFADPTFSAWVQASAASWIQRAALRRSITSEYGPDFAKGTLSSASPFIDTKIVALKNTWHVLEVREEPKMLRVFALLQNNLFVLRCTADRRVFLDVVGDTAPFVSLGGTPAKAKVLPRHANPAGVLIELNIANAADGGDAFVYECRFLREDIFAVYEADVTLAQRFIAQAGCLCAVNSARHLSAIGSKPPLLRDTFQVSELEPHAPAGYLANQRIASAFLFHSAADTRAMLAAVFTSTRHAIIVIVQPAAAQRPNIAWKTLVDEAAESVGVKAPGEMRFTPRFATDIRAGFRIIDEAIVDATTAAPRLNLVVLQSSLPTHTMASSIPQLNQLPVVRVLGSLEDDRIFVLSTLTWVRELGRRMLQRYLASSLWVDERLSISRICGTPLCNLSQDLYVSAFDSLFYRALQRHGHILWDRYDPTTSVPPEERPTQLVAPSGHVRWCAAFSISQLEVIAILFSQIIQEGDDPRSHMLCDGGIASHFHILREIVCELYGLAVAQNEGAVALLLNLRRWIRDNMSETHEPNLVSYISRLVHRSLASLLLRLTKLGGKVVQANTTSVVIATEKHSLQDAKHFAMYLASSLNDHPMLHHLSVQPIRFWRVYMILDRSNYAGLCTEAADASEELLQFDFRFNIWASFSSELKERFVQRVRQYVVLAQQASEQAISDVSNDPSITLATRAEHCVTRTTALLNEIVEEQLQPATIDEVNWMVSEGEAKGAGAGPREYTLALCHFLELMPEVEPAIRRTKNNCLRLCNVGLFAPEASWSSTQSAAQEAQINTQCSFCNEEIALSVEPQGAANARLFEWKCPLCGTTFSKESVEEHLVQRVTRLVNQFSLDADCICSKCKQVSTLSLATLCTCGGQLVGKPRAAALQELRQMDRIAQAHDFQWLLEVVVEGIRALS